MNIINNVEQQPAVDTVDVGSVGARCTSLPIQSASIPIVFILIKSSHPPIRTTSSPSARAAMTATRT